MVMALWNEFLANYRFPEKLLMDQGCNFKVQLIKESCQLAHIHQVQTMPYHPETNSQCERFNQMLINIIGMLESDDKQCWKDYLPTLLHAYNYTKNNATDFSPYYIMYGHKPRLPIDFKFGVMPPQPKRSLITTLWVDTAPDYKNAADLPTGINVRS